MELHSSKADVKHDLLATLKVIFGILKSEAMWTCKGWCIKRRRYGWSGSWVAITVEQFWGRKNSREVVNICDKVLVCTGVNGKQTNEACQMIINFNQINLWATVD